jgi:hypothetical protein
MYQYCRTRVEDRQPTPASSLALALALALIETLALDPLDCSDRPSVVP